MRRRSAPRYLGGKKRQILLPAGVTEISGKNFHPLFLPFAAESFLLFARGNFQEFERVKMNAKQKLPDDQDHIVVFGKEVPRCKARMKNGGGRCTHPAVRGYTVCRMHGANPKNRGGAPPEKMRGNLNGLKHGAYVKRLINEEDHHLFNEMLESIRKDFDLNDSTDQMQAAMASFLLHALASGGGGRFRLGDRNVRRPDSQTAGIAQGYEGAEGAGNQFPRIAGGMGGGVASKGERGKKERWLHGRRQQERMTVNRQT